MAVQPATPIPLAIEHFPLPPLQPPQLVLCQYDTYPVWPAHVQACETPPFYGRYYAKLPTTAGTTAAAYHCYFADDDTTAWIRADLVVPFHPSFLPLVRVNAAAAASDAAADADADADAGPFHAAQAAALARAEAHHARVLAALPHAHPMRLAAPSEHDRLSVAHMLGQWMLQHLQARRRPRLALCELDYAAMLRDGRRLPHCLRSNLAPARMWLRNPLPPVIAPGTPQPQPLSLAPPSAPRQIHYPGAANGDDGEVDDFDADNEDDERAGVAAGSTNGFDGHGTVDVRSRSRTRARGAKRARHGTFAFNGVSGVRQRRLPQPPPPPQLDLQQQQTAAQEQYHYGHQHAHEHQHLHHPQQVLHQQQAQQQAQLQQQQHVQQQQQQQQQVQLQLPQPLQAPPMQAQLPQAHPQAQQLQAPAHGQQAQAQPAALHWGYGAIAVNGESTEAMTGSPYGGGVGAHGARVAGSADGAGRAHAAWAERGGVGVAQYASEDEMSARRTTRAGRVARAGTRRMYFEGDAVSSNTERREDAGLLAAMQLNAEIAAYAHT